MARVIQLQRGIDAALPYAGPTCFHTGAVGVTAGVGNDTQPALGETYVAEVYVPLNAELTGIALLNGSAVGGNVTAILYDSAGAPLAQSASTAQAGAAFQQLPFAGGTVKARGPARYFVGVQFSSTSARFRGHAIGNFLAGRKTGETYGVATPIQITGFTANFGPIADVY